MQIFGLPGGKVTNEVTSDGNIMDDVVLEGALDGKIIDDMAIDDDMTGEVVLDDGMMDEVVLEGIVKDEVALDATLLDNMTDEMVLDGSMMGETTLDGDTTNEIALDVNMRDEMVLDGSMMDDEVALDVSNEVALVGTLLDNTTDEVVLSVKEAEKLCLLLVGLFTFLFLVLHPLNLMSLENAGLTYIGFLTLSKY